MISIIRGRAGKMLKRKLEEIGSALYRTLCFPFIRMGIEIKTKSIMKQGSYINKGTVLEGRNYIGKDVRLSHVRVGYGSVVNGGSDLANTIVGKYASVGAHVVTSEGSHPVDGKHVALHTAFYSTKKTHGYSYAVKDTYDEMKYIDRDKGISVIIGNDVWIGNYVNILEGVTIGDGAAIATGSLITKDVEPYGIYAGVPAKKLRLRFTDDQIDRLERIRWWDKSEEEIRSMVEKGYFDDITASPWVEADR